MSSCSCLGGPALYVKSLVGSGSVTISTNLDTVNIFSPVVTLAPADNVGTNLVADGLGPDLVIKTLQGTGTTTLSLSPNGNVVFIDSSSTDVRLTSVGHGVNLVYDSVGPNVAVKSLTTTETSLALTDDNVGTVTLSTQAYRVDANLNDFSVPGNTWYFATFNNVVSVPTSTGPYQLTSVGSGSPNWVTNVANAGVVDGTNNGGPGNDQAFVRTVFAVPSAYLGSVTTSHFLTLAILPIESNVVTYVGEMKQFRFLAGGSNLFLNSSNGSGVAEFSIFTKLASPRYVVGLYHNLGTSLNFGSVGQTLTASPVGFLPALAPLSNCSLSFQKFSIQGPILPPISPLKVTNLNSQSISTAAQTVIQYPTILVGSTDISWNTGTSTGTALVAGDYYVGANLETGGTGIIVNSRLAVVVNGATDKLQAMSLIQANTGSALSLFVSDVVYLAAGATIQIVFLNLNGVATTTTSNNGLTVSLDIVRMDSMINGVTL